MDKPFIVIISIIVIGIVGIIFLAINVSETEISKDSKYDKFTANELTDFIFQKETITKKISSLDVPIFPISLQKVIDSCKNLNNEINVRSDIKWSNGTHSLTNDICKWQENTLFSGELTDDQLVDIKLHKVIVQNLVKNIIEKYDKEGIENLHQADFVNRLSGDEDKYRYLFIINPLSDVIIAHPTDLKKNLSREILIQNSNSFNNLLADPKNENGFWFKETFSVKNSDVSFDQLLWIVPHDNLIFLSGYVIDKNETAFN